MVTMEPPGDERLDAALLRVAMALRSSKAPDIDEVVLDVAEAMDLDIEALRRHIARHARRLSRTVAEATPRRRGGR